MSTNSIKNKYYHNLFTYNARARTYAYINMIRFYLPHKG